MLKLYVMKYWLVKLWKWQWSFRLLLHILPVLLPRDWFHVGRHYCLQVLLLSVWLNLWCVSFRHSYWKPWIPCEEFLINIKKWNGKNVGNVVLWKLPRCISSVDVFIWEFRLRWQTHLGVGESDLQITKSWICLWRFVKFWVVPFCAILGLKRVQLVLNVSLIFID